jgi:hypothetical protein
MFVVETCGTNIYRVSIPFVLLRKFFKLSRCRMSRSELFLNRPDTECSVPQVFVLSRKTPFVPFRTFLNRPEIFRLVPFVPKFFALSRLSRNFSPCPVCPEIFRLVPFVPKLFTLSRLSRNFSPCPVCPVRPVPDFF